MAVEVTASLKQNVIHTNSRNSARYYKMIIASDVLRIFSKAVEAAVPLAMFQALELRLQDIETKMSEQV